MIKIILNIFRSIGKKNFYKSFKIFLILVGIILLEFLGIYLIIPIVNLFLGNRTKSIEYFSNLLFDESIDNFYLGKLILILFLFITFFRIILYFYFDRKTVTYSRSIEKDITLDLYKFIYNKPWQEILIKDHSSFTATLLSDVPIFISMGLLMSINIFKDLLILLFTILFIFFINELYLLNLIVIFIFLTVIFTLFFRDKVKEISLKHQNVIKFKFQIINEGILGLKDLKLFHNENRITNFINQSEDQITKISLFHRTLRVFPRLFLEFFIILFICSIFIFQLNDQIKLVDKIPSLTLFIFLTFRLLPFFSGINYNLQAIRQHSSQITSVIDNLKLLNKYKKNFIKINDNININKTFKVSDNDKLILKNLFFKYDKDFIIKNLQLQVESGNIIGIFGESGSGKTTLLDLMLGLLKPGQGKILYNNNDINQVGWKKIIGHVSQSIFLFNDSIKNNIILDNFSSYGDLELNNLMKILGLENFIKTLPNGLETKVGDLGKYLSGGQKQKIAFARVLYKNPNIIFLDEATNSIDEDTEDLIFNYLNSIKKNKIIILITHSSRLLKYCDKLFELKNGKLN
jgi:ABC-type bacteriocin/lantibiotic exporter with double-glycine peptidase domain